MADKSTFDEIMVSITHGLSGESDKDVAYLNEQMEKYKDHEYGVEIIRACGRLLYEALPEDKKAELNNAIKKDYKGFEAALEEVKFNQYQKNFDKALELIESMIKKYEQMDMFKDDEVSEYHCFREPMEEIVFRLMNTTEKDIRRSQLDYDRMYLLYGSILFDLHRFDDAEKALATAKRWNPIHPNVAFEYAETFKARGLIDEFGRLTRDIFKIVFHPDKLARCYRNLAYYYVEKQDYKTAVCCLLYSGLFEKNEHVASELYYISQTSGENYNPTREELHATLEEHDIPFGPDEEILKAAYYYGMKFNEQGDKDTAGYFLSIFATYINDDEVNKILEAISGDNE